MTNALMNIFSGLKKVENVDAGVSTGVLMQVQLSP